MHKMKKDLIHGVPLREATSILVLKIIILVISSEVFFIAFAISLLLLPSGHPLLRTIILIVASAVQMLIQTFVIVLIFLRWSGKHARFVDKWLIQSEGIFSSKEKVYDLSNIGTMSIKRNFLGRLLQHGTILLGSSAISGYDSEIQLSNIYIPERVHTYIEQYMSKTLSVNPVVQYPLSN